MVNLCFCVVRYVLYHGDRKDLLNLKNEIDHSPLSIKTRSDRSTSIGNRSQKSGCSLYLRKSYVPMTTY